MIGFSHCHLGFRHLVIFSQIHSKTFSLHSDSDSNFFNLINLMSAALLNSAILDSAHFAQNKFYSLIFTKLDDGSHLEFHPPKFGHYPLGFSHLSYLPFKLTQKHSHSTLTLVQTNSFWHRKTFILTYHWWLTGILMMAAILNSGHLGFSHLSISSQTHSHLPRLVSTICTQKTSLIHSDSTCWWWPSWILPMLDSDTAFLDSDILLSSVRFTQKHSHSTLTLTQTNSIWFKLIHSHLTWWWQESWILSS